MNKKTNIKLRVNPFGEASTESKSNWRTHSENLEQHINVAFRGFFPKTNQQIGLFTMKQNFTNLYAKSNAM